MKIWQLQSGSLKIRSSIGRRLCWLSLIIMIGMVVPLPHPAAAQQHQNSTLTIESTEFSDANIWHSDPSYWKTIQFPDVNGDEHADICGRGPAGIKCALTNINGSTGFNPATLWSSEFSDGFGWKNDPSAWSTIRFPDLNNDKRADVCGRGYNGIYCALSNGLNGFGPASYWTHQFRNQDGWQTNPAYWQTIQFADLNNDSRADVCGRGIDGIICGLSNGQSFGATPIWSSEFSDRFGWKNDPSAWSTIRFPDLNNDKQADVCGRGFNGIYCALSNGRDGFGPASYWTHQFRNQDGTHTDPSYWQTIQFADITGDGKADVCGRGPAGLICRQSTGTTFDSAGNGTVHVPDFSDAKGFRAERFYKTIRLVNVDHDSKADACARGVAGIVCAKAPLNLNTSFGTLYVQIPAFGDVDGWAQAEYYWGTVQPTNINVGIGASVWCGRARTGMRCVYEFDV